jgi:hypothetical protein
MLLKTLLNINKLNVHYKIVMVKLPSTPPSIEKFLDLEAEESDGSESSDVSIDETTGEVKEKKGILRGKL